MICTATELAEKTCTDADSLARALRALAGVGVFAADETGRYSLTPLAELLCSDVPGSQRAFVTMIGAEFHAAWGELLHSVKTGEPGFDRRFSKHFFEYMTEHPERHSIYDAAMETVHGGETEPVLDAYDFSAFKTVVDVGGGNRSALECILRRHPSLRGILFDLPGVAERAREAFSGSDLADRIRIEGGDMFSAIPAGADAYLLRHVLHDWKDPEATAILRKCQEAMKLGSKMLVVEMVIPPGNQPHFGKWLDLMMLLVDGRERTSEEYGCLFSSAGLKMSRIIPTASEVSIVEGVLAV